MDETWLERLFGTPSVARRMIEDSQRTKELAKKGELKGPPVPGSDRYNELVDLAGNFDMTNPIGLGMAGVIRAYHASPHDFNKFSLDHIGKGEGNQAYSRGLYFGENPAVIDDYFHKFNQPEVFIGDRPFEDQLLEHAVENWPSTPEYEKIYERILRLAPRYARDPWGLSDFMEASKNWKTKTAYDEFLTTVMGVPWNIKDTAKHYTVDLDVNPEDLLDWDALLKDQKIYPKIAETEIDEYPTFAGKGIDSLPGDFWQNLQLFKYYDEADEVGKEQMLSRMTRDFAPHRLILDNPSSTLDFEPVYIADRPDFTGQDFVRHIENIQGREDSLPYYQGVGLPGLRYFDGYSRRRGEGTRNYVIYDDDRIKIVDKK